MTTTTHTKGEARAGDWIEVHGLPGRAPRSGQILEVLGTSGHEHYRVRWDEQHESIFYPTEGTTVIRHAHAHAHGHGNGHGHGHEHGRSPRAAR